MGKNALAFLLTALLPLSGTAAWAEPAYKASDIIKHFAPDLGSTRGLCIGTEVECNAGATGARPGGSAEAFDLVVTFDFNSDALTSQARENLNEFYKALADPDFGRHSFLVEGHTDAKGSDKYNLTLSQRRANAVVRYLADKGVNPTKLEPRGFGKTKPRTDDPFDAANRRVETRLRTE
jgi:outer membrane protein OmpA-like peptidoglycan-associated protein